MARGAEMTLTAAIICGLVARFTGLGSLAVLMLFIAIAAAAQALLQAVDPAESERPWNVWIACHALLLSGSLAYPGGNAKFDILWAAIFSWPVVWAGNAAFRRFRNRMRERDK